MNPIDLQRVKVSQDEKTREKAEKKNKSIDWLINNNNWSCVFTRHEHLSGEERL